LSERTDIFGCWYSSVSLLYFDFPFPAFSVDKFHGVKVRHKSSFENSALKPNVLEGDLFFVCWGAVLSCMNCFWYRLYRDIYAIIILAKSM